MGRVTKYDDEALPPVMRSYIQNKAVKSTQTAGNYRQQLHRLNAYLLESGIPLENLTETDMQGFVLWLKEQGSKDTGVSSFFKGVQPFFNWYKNGRGVDMNEVNRIIGFGKQLMLKNTGEHTYPALTKSQEDELFSRLDNPYLRVIAWASIAYGFRAQEVCNLLMEDVQINERGVDDFGEEDWGRVVIRESKGNKTRSVYILREHIPTWKYYLRLRQRDQVPFKNVFYWNGQPLTPSNYSGFFSSKIACLVPFKMSSHSLRRTFGTKLYRKGVGLVVIKNLMGHESIEMTSKYLNIQELETQQTYLKSMKACP